MDKRTFVGKNKRHIVDWIDNMPLVQDKLYDIEIKIHREKRSLDANALAFTIIDKLAKLPNMPTKTEIYRNAIRNIGGVSYMVLVEDKDKEKLSSQWEKHGLGWFCDFIDSNNQGCSNAILYYGSSMYNTKQMSDLINNLLVECENQGLDFIPRSEVERIVSQWDNYDGK